MFVDPRGIQEVWSFHFGVQAREKLNKFCEILIIEFFILLFHGQLWRNGGLWHKVVHNSIRFIQNSNRYKSWQNKNAIPWHLKRTIITNTGFQYSIGILFTFYQCNQRVVPYHNIGSYWIRWINSIKTISLIYFANFQITIRSIDWIRIIIEWAVSFGRSRARCYNCTCISHWWALYKFAAFANANFSNWN